MRLFIASVKTPGKVILFGEYAVVHGHPAISMSVNRYIRTSINYRASERLIFQENGRPITIRSSPHVKLAHDLYKVYFREYYNQTGIYNINISSDIPSASGLGSSAAIVVSVLASMLAANLHGLKDISTFYNLKARIAQAAFETEYQIQGKASPVDTSTVTNGKSLYVSMKIREEYPHLWTIEKGQCKWSIHQYTMPEDFIFVVGYTGIRGRTVEIWKSVMSLLKRHKKFSMDILNEIGALTAEAQKAIKHRDHTTVGELMCKNHKLLCTLGIGHEALDKIYTIAMKRAYGAKITGAGGGGCVIALSDEDNALKVKSDIEQKGFTAYIIKESPTGVNLEFFDKNMKET